MINIAEEVVTNIRAARNVAITDGKHIKGTSTEGVGRSTEREPGRRIEEQ